MAQSHTRYSTRLFALGAALLLAACAPAAPPAWRGDLQLRGTVIAVEDGDTLTLRGTGAQPARWRIRLSDIDAPETRHGAERPGQPMGREAGAALRALVLDRDVLADCFEADRFGRLVCHVYVDGARPVHRALLRDGLAWPAERPEWIRDPASLAAAEEARSAGRGLWADDARQPPWLWRRTCWATPSAPEACPNALRD